MLERIIKTISIARASKAFGMQNSVASKALAEPPFTVSEFNKKSGQLTKNASPTSLRGGINSWITTVSDIQTFREPNVNDLIKKRTNPLSFAVQNTTETPFDRQGDLSSLAGQTGRRLNTSA